MDILSLRRVGETASTKTGFDEQDFTRLYQSDLGRVLNYVRYRLGAEAAEDLTADIFARAWERRQGYDPRKGTHQMWLWGIARNGVKEWLRQRGRRPDCVEIPSNLVGEPGPPTETGPENDWRQIQIALTGLHPVDREIIALRFGAGHTNRAIAGLVGMNEAAVAQRLRRALRKLRIELQGDDLR